MSKSSNGRANETRTPMRDGQGRPETAWKPPALLDAPEPRPGYQQRWVATSIQGRETPDNVYKRMREGWEKRDASTVKDQTYATINHGQWAGCIGVEGMLLCEMPENRYRQMKQYYSGKNDDQNSSIAHNLDEFGRRNGQQVYQDRKSESNHGQVIPEYD